MVKYKIIIIIKFTLLLFLFFSCKQNEHKKVKSIKKTSIINGVKTYIYNKIDSMDVSITTDSSLAFDKKLKRFYFNYLKYSDKSFIKIYHYQGSRDIFWEWGDDSRFNLQQIKTSSSDFDIVNKNKNFIIVNEKQEDIILKIKPNLEFYKIKDDIPYIILGYSFKNNTVVYIKNIKNSKVTIELLDYAKNKKKQESFEWKKNILLPQTIFDTIIFKEKSIDIKYFVDTMQVKIRKIKYP